MRLDERTEKKIRLTIETSLKVAAISGDYDERPATEVIKLIEQYLDTQNPTLIDTINKNIEHNLQHRDIEP